MSSTRRSASASSRGASSSILTAPVDSHPSAVSEVVAHLDDTDTAGGGEVVVAGSSPSSKSDGISRAGTMALRRELEAARADAERERTLRGLDRTKAEQTEARLRRQVAFLMEEAEDNRALHEKFRAQSESDTARLSTRLEDALANLGECERRLVQATRQQQQQGSGGGGDNQRQRVMLLQPWKAKVDAMEGEATQLREALRDAEERAVRAEERLARSAAAARGPASDEDEGDECADNFEGGMEHADEGEQGEGKRRQQTDDGTASSPSPPQRTKKRQRLSSSSPLSPAPPAVMRELTKTRIKLAEEERTTRTLQRKLEDAKRRLAELPPLKETARRDRARAERLESEAKKLRRERELARAAEEQWAAFRREIDETFREVAPPLDDGVDVDAEKSDKPLDGMGVASPPEVASVVRHFRALRKNVAVAEKERDDQTLLLESSRRRVKVLEGRLTELSSSAAKLERKNADLRKEVDIANAEVRKAQLSERIGKSEAGSMRILLETYEVREAAAASSSSRSPAGTASALEGPTIAGLRTSLASANEEIDGLKAEQEKSRTAMDSLRREHDEAKQEHERVLEKFGKLRDALLQEREKAEDAEGRASKAESLAGKGGYNDQLTKVLHLKQNPLMQAVREKFEAEIDSLKETIASSKTEVEQLRARLSSDENDGGPTSASSAVSAGAQPPSAKDTVDAQKYHQRLKESFKEQIGIFREGVYLITGYKVDMFSDTDRPRFKVRSMYAEKEEDHLMFMWPEAATSRGGRDTSVTSLDLLDTEYAQALSKTDNFSYVTNFNSIPAFMASLTMSLFENQTYAG